jgi:hypothetical protein
MTTYRFETVPHQAVKSLPCPSCGKKVRRQRTFTMTINPWNKDPETGLQRTLQQILAALKVQAEAWQAQPETCSKCEQASEVTS